MPGFKDEIIFYLMALSKIISVVRVSVHIADLQNYILNVVPA